MVPLRALQDGERAEIDVAIGPLTTRLVALHTEVDDGAAGGVAGFVDTLERGPFRSWRHEHRFHPVDAQRCRLVDRITFSGPLLGVGDGYVLHKLGRMFRHRHDTTRLDAELLQALSSSSSSSPLRIGMTGSSGVIGTELHALLSVAGHEVVPIVRTDLLNSAGARANTGAVSWDVDSGALHGAGGLDAVVHLAGENIAAGRLDDAKMQRLRSQRIDGTRKLLDALAALPDPPRVVVSAGAVGCYGDRGDDVVDEDSVVGAGLLASLCAGWEDAVLAPRRLADRDRSWRAVVLRIGIVQTPRGGALHAQLPAFRAGVGGPLGDGKAWVAAVTVDDVAAMFLRALLDERCRGIVNAVGVESVRGGDYARTLGRVLRRPALLPVPRAALRVVVGDLAPALLESQRVRPSRLLGLGHRFRHDTVEAGLRHVLGRR